MFRPRSSWLYKFQAAAGHEQTWGNWGKTRPDAAVTLSCPVLSGLFVAGGGRKLVRLLGDIKACFRYVNHYLIFLPLEQAQRICGDRVLEE